MIKRIDDGDKDYSAPARLKAPAKAGAFAFLSNEMDPNRGLFHLLLTSRTSALRRWMKRMSRRWVIPACS